MVFFYNSGGGAVDFRICRLVATGNPGTAHELYLVTGISSVKYIALEA